MTYFSGPECHQPHAGGRTSSQIYTERWNQIRSSFILFLVDKRDQVKRSESRKGSQMDLSKFMGKMKTLHLKLQVKDQIGGTYLYFRHSGFWGRVIAQGEPGLHTVSKTNKQKGGIKHQRVKRERIKKGKSGNVLNLFQIEFYDSLTSGNFLPHPRGFL
jgi:hypothetical protein